MKSCVVHEPGSFDSHYYNLLYYGFFANSPVKDSHHKGKLVSEVEKGL
jgi:hypothetical protein